MLLRAHSTGAFQRRPKIWRPRQTILAVHRRSPFSGSTASESLPAHLERQFLDAAAVVPLAGGVGKPGHNLPSGIRSESGHPVEARLRAQGISPESARAQVEKILSSEGFAHS